MILKFQKYQGTGNDFIIIDNRKHIFNKSNTALITELCDRRFGIGADGLMLLENEPGYDFKMVYFNSDGNESSMCGNGGRCIVDFANRAKIINGEASFIAIDGAHKALIKDTVVSLKMNDVQQVESSPGFYFLNTGSPHYVAFTENITSYNVFEQGKKIRYNERFKKEGTNVNFIEKNGNALFVRTYERGVENETLSCGTGVTAAALVAALAGMASSENHCDIKTLGGSLSVKFNKTANGFSNVWLEGPATFVYSGEIEI